MTPNPKRIVRKLYRDQKLLHKPTKEDLEKAISAKGYKIYYFSKYSPESIVFINSLDKRFLPAAYNAAVYSKDHLAFVLVNKDLSDEDIYLLLCHEAGHLYNPLYGFSDINHIKIRDEEFANEFSYHLRHPSLLDRIAIFFRHKVAVYALLAMLVCFIGSFAGFYALKSYYTQHVPASVNSVYEQYYVTSGGKKYHRSYCNVIKNKTGLTSLTLEEAERMGYKPCLLCIGENNLK